MDSDSGNSGVVVVAATEQGVANTPKRRSSCATPKTNKIEKKKRNGSNDMHCKTCSYCRLKKIKCDSIRPSCRACECNNVECVYPQDTRRLVRPSQGRIDALEQQLSGIMKHISSAQVDKMPMGHDGTGTDAIQSPHPAFPSTQLTASATPAHDPLNPRAAMQAALSNSASFPTPHSISPIFMRPERVNDNGISSTPQASLSPREAQIAGLDVSKDGDVSVHGPSSMMHQERAIRGGALDEPGGTDESFSLHAAKARLVSYAAIQRQSESFMYRNLGPYMDFDGVEPELARHLLDLHWNRQHYAYLLTYRPAVMDSLANGGRWCNKLLLNAMYYTSCLYSDRECLRSSPGDTQSAGDRFYKRFRELLVDDMIKPSIPSAAAVLLIGPSLVSQGRISAGWNLCGIGYRMVTDMGCHLTMSSQSHPTAGKNRDISLDIEYEWRRRLYWGALVTDATQSLYLGRQMSLRPDEGRVSKLFLDTYEELEEWKPYMDETQSRDTYKVLHEYQAKPAYALSTFGSLIKLALIAARITQAFYDIGCVKKSPERLVQAKLDLEKELLAWRTDLPEHLRFASGWDVPPPHQITPHTTYHVLNILLHRPFLAGGHLQDHASRQDQSLFESRCVESALAIQQLVSDYRDSFTLRRAPFLLSYAVYSAVVVILRHCKSDYSNKFKESMTFFLTALTELQRGCNFGLRKPVSIIKKMTQEIGGQVAQQLHFHAYSGSGMDGGFISDDVAVGSDMLDHNHFAFNMPGLDHESVEQGEFALGRGDSLFDATPEGFFDILDDQERIIADDTLYGLFAHQASAY